MDKTRVKLFIFSWPTAMTGQCPQEGPQLVAAQLPQPAPPADVLPIFPAKADKSRSAFVRPALRTGDDCLFLAAPEEDLKGFSTFSASMNS